MQEFANELLPKQELKEEKKEKVITNSTDHLVMKKAKLNKLKVKIL